MKKIGIIILMLLLVGCSNQKEKNTVQETIAAPEETECEQVKSEQKTSEPINKISELQLLSNKKSQHSCSTENGFYYITLNDSMKKDDFVYHIRYIDFATKQDVYLCNKPECKHDTEECNAYLSYLNEGYDVNLVTDQKYLYLLVYPHDPEGEIRVSSGSLEGGIFGSPEQDPGVIYRMNLDGTNREKVYEFEEAETLGETVCKDANNLYVLVKQVTEDTVDDSTTCGTAKSKKIVKISLDDFSKQDEIEIDTEYNICGCFEQSFVLEKSQYGSEYSNVAAQIDDETSKKALKTETITVAKLDITTKEQTILKEIKGDGMKSYGVGSGYIYYTIQNQGVMNQIRISDGKESTLAKVQSELITDIGEDWILCESYALSGKPQLIQVKGTTIKEFSLCSSDGFPILILGSNSNYYLVLKEFSGTKEVFALIRKEDFLNQKASYEKINMLEDGFRI